MYVYESFVLRLSTCKQCSNEKKNRAQTFLLEFKTTMTSRQKNMFLRVQYIWVALKQQSYCH